MKKNELLQKLQNRIDEMQLTMNPTVSMSVLHSIESASGVKLPKEYVDFICKIGNGGQFPKRSDSAGILLPLEQCDLKRVSQTFPYTETHMWRDDDYDYAGDPDKRVEESENGHFAFMECADDLTWDLIVTGKCRGEVWMFGADGMMRGKGLGFLEWAQLYLNDKLTLRIQNSVPKDSLTGYFERIQKKIIMRKVIMNPPISIEEVRKIEQEYKISFPEDYVAFITTIGDGCKLMPSNDIRPAWRELRSIKDYDFSKASKPFPLTERWSFGWNRKTGTVNYDIIADIEGRWAETQNGQFRFIEMEKAPCTSPLTLLSYSLITCGPCYGEVWATLNGSILRAGKHTFSSWFEFYLDGHD